MTWITDTTNTLAAMGNLIRDEFEPELIKYFEQEFWIMAMFPKDKFDTDSLKIDYDLGGNYNTFAKAERAALPTPTSMAQTQGSAAPKYIYQPLDITGPQLEGAKTWDNRFDMIAREFTNSYDNLMFAENRYFFGDGSARIAQVNGSATYDSSAGYTSFAVDGGSMFHFRDQMKISFGTDGTDYRILKTDRPNKTLYVEGDASSDASDNDWIYQYDTFDATLDTEPMGLVGHISNSNPASGTYQGLDRDNIQYDFLKSWVKDLSSAAIDENEIMKFLDNIEQRGNRFPELLLPTYPVFRSIQMLFAAEGRQMPPVIKEIGSQKALQYIWNGRPVTIKRCDDIRPGYMYALCPEFIKIKELKPLGWLDKTGDVNNKLRRKEGYDIYEGYLAHYYNVIGTRPNAHGVMTAIKEDDIT